MPATLAAIATILLVLTGSVEKTLEHRELVSAHAVALDDDAHEREREE